MIFIGGSAADSQSAYNSSAAFQWHPASKGHQIAALQALQAIKLTARLHKAVQLFR